MWSGFTLPLRDGFPSSLRLVLRVPGNSPADGHGILPQVQNGDDDNEASFCNIKDALREVPHQHPAIIPDVGRAEIRMPAQNAQRSINLPHQDFTSAALVIFVTLVS